MGKRALPSKIRREGQSAVKAQPLLDMGRGRRAWRSPVERHSGSHGAGRLPWACCQQHLWLPRSAQLLVLDRISQPHTQSPCVVQPPQLATLVIPMSAFSCTSSPAQEGTGVILPSSINSKRCRDNVSPII